MPNPLEKSRSKPYHRAMVSKGSIFGRLVKAVLIAAGAFVICALLVLAVPNLYEVGSQAGRFRSADEASELAQEQGQYDCILVLGASVLPSGEPSTILADRIDVAVELYNAGVAPKIIMSGDDESENTYDEVNNMKAYAVGKGVPSEDIFCDHAGINTYDSMYRACYVFNVKRMAVVTQTYHLYRALFDAESFGIECIGVSSDLHEYAKQRKFNARELLARASDMVKVLSKQNAAYLSAPVSLDQSGDVTSW